MSVNLTINGVVYPYPDVNDENWGTDATAWASAISLATLQKTGGTFTLSAEVDFGASFGIKALYLKSRGTNISSAGIIRLANAESVSWRNAANGADLALTASASDRLTFGGVNVPTISSTDTLTNKTLTSPAITTPTGLVKGDVGLGNVDNTSDATKNAASVTLTNKTLTSPVINTPTGIVKGDVGLGNVDNTSDANKPVSTAQQTALNLKANLASPTFTGTVVLPSGQALIAPALGTPASGVMTNVTGLPVSTGISGLGTGVATFLATPSSANLAAAMTDETGTGANVFATSPVLVTPALGTPSSGVLTNCTGLPIAGGGTGQTTANAALNALLPSQGSASGKVLSSNGTDTSWASAASSTQAQYTVDVGDASNARTAVNTNLLGEVKGSTLSQTATMTIAAPGVVTSNSHGLALGDKFYFTTSGALPTGVTASTTYYAGNIATNTFNICTSYANAIAGTYLTTTGSQSGTHTLFTGGLNRTAGALRGVLSGTAITSGYVGEMLETRQTTASVAAATGTYKAVTQLTLTPGIWDVQGNVTLDGNGSTVAAAANQILALGTTSASSTGTAFGSTLMYNTAPVANAANAIVASWCTARIRVSVSVSTTYYLNCLATFTGTAPQWYGCIVATRVA